MPDDEISNIGSPVKDFVSNFLKQAEDGLKEQGYITCPEDKAHVKIDLVATEAKEASGGLRIRVFSLSGKASDSNTQRMTLFCRKWDEAVDSEEKARIAKAEQAASEKIVKLAKREPWIQ